ncbi:MAG: HAD-IA family hydrolase [Bacteroidetes bacterium]|nr:HAD-IA family hydrolase [Bacteroidota bacterium]
MNEQQTTYKCIIFDMDGTLTQTNQLIYDSFNHIAEKYINKRLTPAEVIAYFGPPEKEAVEAMIGSEQIETAMKEYYSFYHSNHNQLASLYPGIVEILNFLKEQQVRIGLFTGKGRNTTDITLQQFEIEQYFDLTITGDDVDEFKPSGDGIRKIMQKFSLRPDEVLMVGDAVADIKAARETNVQIASVLWDSYGKDAVLQLQSDFIFHSVEEFSRWLQLLYSKK